MAGAGTFLVVDASVSLKWALDDEDAVAQAVTLRNDALRGRGQMVAPSLWLYQVTNGLVMAARRGRLAAEAGLRALSLLLALGVRVADPEASLVYETAQRYGIAAYDAAYLALALTLQADLWTGDYRLYQATAEAAGLVHWIGDYPVD